MPPRTLVTVLGANAEAKMYEWGGKQVKAPLTSLAISQLLGGVDRVIALCTAEAKQSTYPILDSGLRVGIERVPVDLPNDRTVDRPRHLLPPIVQPLTGGSTLILDITHGFRDLSLLALLAAVYLNALDEVTIEHAFYGLVDKNTDLAPLIDLRFAFDLLEYASAARELQVTRTADLLARTLRNSTNTKPIAKRVEEVIFAFSSGLPLEAGRATARLAHDIVGLKKHLQADLLADQIVRALQKPLEGLQLQTPQGDDWKGKLVLDRAELDRQATFVDVLLERRAWNTASLVMREWAVSAACLRLGLASSWLERDTREQAELRLTSLERRCSHQILGKKVGQEQKELADWWREITRVRNPFAHAGMTKNDLLRLHDRHRRKLRERWSWVKQYFWDVPLDQPTHGVLLVTPVGLQPSIVSAAIAACPAPPDGCLCICSPQTRNDALTETKRYGVSPHVHVIPNPYDDVGRLSGDLSDDIVKILADSGRVLVNLTGGTTLMGLYVQRVVDEAKRLGIPTRRFGLVDPMHGGGKSCAFWLDTQ